MPTIPLFVPNPPHPDASYQVLAPGGYERWYFDAESDDGSVRVVAAFSLGTADHPDYERYVRSYRQYLRTPTRRRPPVCADYACVSVAVHAAGYPAAARVCPFSNAEFRKSQDTLHVSTGSDVAKAESDGSVRLQIGRDVGSGPSADLRFRPVLSGAPTRDTGSGSHWLVVHPSCEVDGTVAAGTSAAISFIGRGFHGHSFGTRPAEKQLRGRVLGDGRAIAFLAEDADGRCVEFGRDEMREHPLQVPRDSGRVPTRIEMPAAGLVLGQPRVLGHLGAIGHVLYEVSGPPSWGRTALCEWG